jgi:hypothetical protein
MKQKFFIYALSFLIIVLAYLALYKLLVWLGAPSYVAFIATAFYLLFAGLINKK